MQMPFLIATVWRTATRSLTGNLKDSRKNSGLLICVAPAAAPLAKSNAEGVLWVIRQCMMGPIL